MLKLVVLKTAGHLIELFCKTTVNTVEPHDLVFEFHHLHDAREVQALLGELLNPAQQTDVSFGIAPCVPGRSVGMKQSLTFIHAQGLWMHAGQLGRYRDYVYRLLAFGTILSGRAAFVHLRSPPRCVAGVALEVLARRRGVNLRELLERLLLFTTQLLGDLNLDLDQKVAVPAL